MDADPIIVNRRTWIAQAACVGLLVAAACGPKTPRDELRLAIRSGKVERVEAALGQGAKLDGGFSGGQTGLHVLADVRTPGTGEVAKFLLDQGVDAKAKDDEGRTAWDLVFDSPGSVNSRQALFLIALLESGFRPETKGLQDGRTVLHQVAGRVESSRLIELLVKEGGFDVNAGDDYGWTPLHVAVHEQNVEAATGLLTNGANVNAETTKLLGKKAATKAGVTPRWRWKYEAGSRPLDVMPQTRQRLGGDVRKVVREYGGTENETLDNRRK